MTKAELEKENAELKADNDARKFAMVMSEKVEKQLREENAEAKKLLKQWLQTTQANGCDNINIVADTQNFLKE